MRVQNGFYGSLNGALELGEMPFGALDYAADQEEAVQRSKCGTWGYRLGNGVYALCVSLLFASFNQRHGHSNFGKIGYAWCSFRMNAPMAYLFTDNVKNMISRLRQRREPLFFAAFLMSFLLATGTTVAGLQVAKESVQGVSRVPSQLVIPLMILSAWNTFSTRFVGSTDLLFKLMVFFRNSVNRLRAKYSAYFNLLDDLKNHGNRLKNLIHLPAIPGTSPRQLLVNYLTQLYSHMSQEGLRPGITWRQFVLKNLLRLGTGLILFVFIANMLPLWLKLTAEGFSKLDLESVSKNDFAVWCAAASNQLFYISFGINFLPSLISIAKAVGTKTKTALKNTDSIVKKIFILSALFFGTAEWAVSAYYSGAGFAVDARGAMKEGFGSVGNTYFKIPLFGAWTKFVSPIYDSLIQTSAGLIVNGGADLRFKSSRISFFKAAEKTPKGMLGNAQMIESLQDDLDHGNFEALNEMGVKDVAYHARKHARPIPTLWQSMKHCMGFEEDSAAQPLVSPQQPSVHAV